MANFTALKTAINNAIKTNGNEEITGAILQAILDAMVETLGDSAITDLENAITTEVTNRENAVGGVADDLAAEVQARQALDYNVNNRINAEEYNRQNADAALSQTMSQGFQTLGSQMTALNAAISALNAAYQNGFLYGGIATPSSSPSNNKCFYIALQGGTYTNFGGVGVVEGINIIKNDSGWKVEHIYDQTTLLNEFYLLRQQVIQAITSFAPIVIEGDVTNAPDEEDLTSNANHLLQFKNNAYSPLEFSGLGRKYLRKNIAPLSESAPFNGFVEGVTAEATLSGTPTQIFWDRINTRFVGIKDGVYYLDWTDSDNYVPVSTSLVYMYNGTPYQWTGSDFIVDESEVPNLVNCLTQDMINEASTIYIIRYDYTLKENITIPANCVLEFDGGSLSGAYNLGYNGALLQGDLKVSCICSGSVRNESATPQMYGAKGDGETDDTIAIQNCINGNNSVIFPFGTYIIGNTSIVRLHSNLNLNFADAIIKKATASTITNSIQMFLANDCDNVVMQGGIIIGDLDAHKDTWNIGTEYQNTAIYFHHCTNCIIKNVTTKKHIGDGIYIGTQLGYSSTNILIEDCKIYETYRNGISVTGCNGIVIRNCIIDKTYWLCCIDIEPASQVADKEVTDVLLDNVKTSNRGGSSPELNVYKANDIRAINCSIQNTFYFINCDGNVSIENCNFGSLSQKSPLVEVFKIFNCVIGHISIDEDTLVTRIENSSIERIESYYGTTTISAVLLILQSSIVMNTYYNLTASFKSIEIYNTTIILNDKVDGNSAKYFRTKATKLVKFDGCRFVVKGTDSSWGLLSTNNCEKLIFTNNTIDLLEQTQTSENGIVGTSCPNVYWENNVINSNSALGGVYGGNLIRFYVFTNVIAYFINNIAPKYTTLYGGASQFDGTCIIVDKGNVLSGDIQ